MIFWSTERITFATRDDNVCNPGCKRLREKMQCTARTDAVHCRSGCSALQERLQCTAGAVAVHCRGGCNALRLRRAKGTSKSPVLFWIRDKGGETHPIRVSVAPPDLSGDPVSAREVHSALFGGHTSMMGIAHPKKCCITPTAFLPASSSSRIKSIYGATC